MAASADEAGVPELNAKGKIKQKVKFQALANDPKSHRKKDIQTQFFRIFA